MRVIVVAGGTGGHIFPAISVMQELRSRGHDILWVTTDRGNELDLATRFNLPVKTYQVEGMKRSLSLQPIKAGVKMALAAFQISKMVKKWKPDAVIAFGGYVCAPLLWVAQRAKIPTFLHEQNSVPGMVNRLFSDKSVCNFLGMPLSDGSTLSGSTLSLGIPLRKAEITYSDFAFPKGIDRSRTTLLICGGSQGSLSMNRYLIEPLKKLASEGIQIIWQTGGPSYSEISAAVEGFEQIKVFDTIPDLYPYYSIATLLIARAGAGTISEAAYFKLPSILIPLPWSSENHQWHNAGFAQSEGWAQRIEQKEGCDELCYEMVKKLLTDSDEYNKMKLSVLSKPNIDVASQLVERVENYVK